MRKPLEASEEVLAEPEFVHAQKPFLEAWQLSGLLLKGWWNEIQLPLNAGPASDTSETHLPETDEPRLAAHSGIPPLKFIDVKGVVYTTVLNPADGRKNWIDLITAFCWAFKETEDATLIVKMTHHDLEHYRIVLMTLLSRLAPFRCRVIVLHGFLQDEHYQALIQASSYYVNASSCEGLCLPLMEFLSSGKPALAPDHTAMADYLSEEVAFILKYCLEPTCWPHDPTGMLLTHKHRLNWQSLMEAFRNSYQLASTQPAQYQAMSRSAYQQLQQFASVAQVSAPLAAFLHKVINTEAAKNADLPEGSRAQ